jgi:hypothetical protein
MITHHKRRLFLSVAAGALVLGGALQGCAASRLLKNPLPAADLNWEVSAADGATLELHQLIVRNGGGSWVRDASWDEYVLTIRNDSRHPMEIQTIELYSDRLPMPQQSSTDQRQLDAQSSATLRALKDAGVVAGAGVVVPTALVAGTVGAGGGGLVAVGAAATVAVVALPVGLIGGTVYVVRRHHREQQDKVLIERALRQRGLGAPMRVAAGVQLETSAFFAVTPAPARLVLHYALDGSAGQVALDLPGLASLHLKPLRSTAVADPAWIAMH